MTAGATPDGLQRTGARGGGLDLAVWGCGGSVPVGRPGRARWGGDTTCLEVRRIGAAEVLVVDLGSGARDLGAALAAEAETTGRAVRAEVLLSHFHLDHVIGLPFFAPLYDDAAQVTLHAGLVPDDASLAARLRGFAAPPWFPIEPLARPAARFRALAPGRTFRAAGFEVTPFPCRHPGGAIGFRIACAEASVAVVGDHEHGDPEIDRGVAEAVAGADLMIYDAAYEDADYPAHRGWGHSTWQVGADLARAAGVGRVLFHHHLPSLDDADLDARDARIRAAAPFAQLARQGMRLRVQGGAVEGL